MGEHINNGFLVDSETGALITTSATGDFIPGNNGFLKEATTGALAVKDVAIADALATAEEQAAIATTKAGDAAADRALAQTAASVAQAVAQYQPNRDPVRLATASALPANTYNNGAGTITITATGVLTVDGQAVALNDDIVVKNEATQANNGIYRCTTAGATGVAAVLTRRTTEDTGAELANACVQVQAGTINAGWVYLCQQSAITLGTTAVTFLGQPASVAAEAVVRAAADALLMPSADFDARFGDTFDPEIFGYASVRRDVTGRILSYVNDDEATERVQFPTAFSSMEAAKAKITGSLEAFGATMDDGGFDPEIFGYIEVSRDSTGRILTALQDDGTFVGIGIKADSADEFDPTPIYTLMLPSTGLHLAGDSLSQRLQSYGGMASKFTVLGDPRSVTYDARGGTTGKQIVRRVGVYPTLWQVASNTIPATTDPVACTKVSNDDDFLYSPATQTDTVTRNGWLGGIYGALTKAADRSYSFTRAVPGAAVTVDAEAVFRLDRTAYDSRIAVMWPGRNDDLTHPVTGPANYAAYLAYLADWVASLKPYTKRYLVLGHFNRRFDEAGGQLTFPSDQIPASGGVTVTLTSNIAETVDAAAPAGISGIVAGVQGTITVSAGVYTFTRETAGSIVAAPALSVFQSNALIALLNNNRATKAKYGMRFVDTMEVLRRAADLSSQDDLDDLAAGCAPRSCYADLTHENEKGGDAIGTAVVERITFFKQIDSW